MADDSFRNLIIGMIMLIGFIFYIILFVSGIGLNYGKDTSEFEAGGSYNLSSVNATLTDLDETAEGWKSMFWEGNILNVDSIATIFNTVKNMISLVTLPLSLTYQILTNIFHFPASVIGLITAIVVIIIIFGAWAVWRAGK